METTEKVTSTLNTSFYVKAITLPAIVGTVIVLLSFINLLITEFRIPFYFTIALLLGAWIGINALEEGGSLTDALVLAVLLGIVIGIVEFLFMGVFYNLIEDIDISSFESFLDLIVENIIIYGFGGFAIGRIYQVLMLDK